MTTATDETVDIENAIPLSWEDTGADFDSEYNVKPLPILEKNEDGKNAEYVADLYVGDNGLKKGVDKKGNTFFRLDLRARVIAGHNNEFDLNGLQTFVQPAPNDAPSSYKQNDKPYSSLINLGKNILGLDPKEFESPEDFFKATAQALSASPKPQAIVTGQWQWYSKTETWVSTSGEKTGTGKVVKYGSKNAQSQLPSGRPNHILHYDPTNENLEARFVVTRIKALV